MNRIVVIETVFNNVQANIGRYSQIADKNQKYDQLFYRASDIQSHHSVWSLFYVRYIPAYPVH